MSCVSNLGIIETQYVCIILYLSLLHISILRLIRKLAVNFTYYLLTVLICETINVIIDIEIS